MWWLGAALGCGAPPGTALPCPTGDCRGDVVELAVGDAFGCARAANGQVWCWGRNNRGQLGRGDFLEESSPAVVVDDAIALGAGEQHLCAVRVGGRVSCWGANDHYQVSRESGDWAGPRDVSLPEPAVGVAGGADGSCAWAADGAVWCWGRDVASPKAVVGISALEVVFGRRPCARTAQGNVECWGPGGDVSRWTAGADRLAPGDDLVILRGATAVLGVLGDGEVGEKVVGSLAGARDLALSDSTAWVRAGDGRWSGFSLRDGRDVAPPAPRVDAIAARGKSTCYLVSGTVRCIGVDAAGLRRRGILRPVQVDRSGILFAGGASTCVVGASSTRCHDAAGTREVALGEVASLAVGERTRLLARPDGKVFRWDADPIEPFPVPAPQLGAGDNLGCGVEPGGTVVCAEPGGEPVARPIRARSIGVGGRFACAVDAEGVVSCWEGALGESQAIAGLAPATQVAVGTNIACAVTEAGVWCWNHWRGGMAAPTSPVSAGVDDAVQLALGMEHGCALDSGGGVWCWGRNDAGQLGDGTTRGRTRAAQVIGLGPAQRVDAGHSHSCAELRDGAVWCWGHPAGLGQALPAVDPASPATAPRP